MLCEAFLAGAPKWATGHVFYGTAGGVLAEFKKAKAIGQPWYYIDNSYFDTHLGRYFRVTKNALQVNPDRKTSTGDRFAKLCIDVEPWRYDGIYYIIVPQSDDFMRNVIGCKHDWTADVHDALIAFGVPDKRIKVREWTRDKAKAIAGFYEELKTARMVITYSSNAAITSMIKGVQAVSEAGSAHWATGSLGILNMPPLFSGAAFGHRGVLFNILADNQWTIDELKDGTAWRWLEKQ